LTNLREQKMPSGSWHGAHVTDIPLADIADLKLAVREPSWPAVGCTRRGVRP
jgi:hypothetical protein